MPHAQLTQFVRRLVSSALPGSSGADREALEESILIRQGIYCGRRFQAADGYAIWFVEENQIKVFDDGGKLLDVLQITSEQLAPAPGTISAQRLAA